MVEIIDSCSQFHFLIFIRTLTIWIDDGISLFMLCIWHYNSLGLLLGHMLSGIFFKFILTFEYTRQNCQLASILAIDTVKICANFFSTHSTSISSLLVFASFIDPYWLFSQLNAADCIFVPPHFCTCSWQWLLLPQPCEII